VIERHQSREERGWSVWKANGQEINGHLPVVAGAVAAGVVVVVYLTSRSIFESKL
jgi:hypothetical protein